MFNAVLPENIGRARVGVDWDRGDRPEVRLPAETILKLREDLRRQTIARDMGTIRKAEKARSMRANRQARYKYSKTTTQIHGAYRYLTDDELDKWYERLNICLGKKVKVPK
jgi:hypothetical protein